MPQKLNELEDLPKKIKRAYEKPVIMEEEVFDRTVLQACSGCECSNMGEDMCE